MAERKPYHYSPVTDRGLEIYEDLLAFPTQNLQGGIVLDVGAGRRLTFAREAAERDIRVISVNPQLELPQYRSELEIVHSSISVPAVAAIAQALPFADNSFDAVTSLYTVPYWIPHDERQIRMVFEELMRVLKPGGLTYLCPVRTNTFEESDKAGWIRKSIVDKGYVVYAQSEETTWRGQHFLQVLKPKK